MQFSLTMATFQDATRARWSAITNMLDHPLIGEVVIVDNDPNGPSSAELKSAALSDPRIRYVEHHGPSSTSQPRNRCFEEARFDHVICVDSHVKLLGDQITYGPGGGVANVRAGAVNALARFYQDKGADCPDLVHGPIITERGTLYGTHFNDQWRSEMWGTWGVAWKAPNGLLFTPWNPAENRIAYKTMGWPQTEIPEADLGLDKPPTGWAGHENVIRLAGCVAATELADPFPIPGMGFGAFACRKDSWLATPFHRAMRGFGGEELSHHVGVRKAGKEVWCVPGFRFWHDFYRLQVPYPAPTWDKVRSYYLQFKEYGIPMAELVSHFVKFGGVQPWEWERYVKANRREANGAVEVSPVVPKWLRGSVERNENPPYERLEEVEHLLTTRKVNLVEWNQIMAGADWPSTTSSAPPPPGRVPFVPGPEHPMQIIMPIEAKPEAGMARPMFSTKPPETVAPIVEMMPGSLEATYQEHCNAGTGLSPHLPKLREFAAGCGVVVETGTRYGAVTSALLAGQPTRLVTIDLNQSPEAHKLVPVSGPTKLDPVVGDSRQVDIPECDLLVLGAVFTADYAWAELQKHKGKVRRAVAFLGAEKYGMFGDGDKKAGVLHAAKKFMEDDASWFVASYQPTGDGLLILSKDDRDRPAKKIPVPFFKKGGVGSAFRGLTEKLGIKAAVGCSCNAIAHEMDRLTVDQVVARRDEFIAGLRENGKKFSWFDKMKAAGNAVATGLALSINPVDPIPSLLEMAIRQAREEEAADV